jgi:hypothetical protein
MSRIRTNLITNRMANGAPTVSNGLVISGVTTSTSFSGDGSNLTSLPTQVTINNNADNRVITGGSGVNLYAESGFTYDGTNLRLGTTTAAISAGKGLMIADAAGARIKLCDSDQGVTASDGFEIIQSNGGNAFIYNRENSPIIFGTNNTERMRITHEGSVGIGTDGSTYELEVHDGTGAAALRMKDGANNVICDLIANSNGGLLRTTYNHPLIFHTNQTERLRITNTGHTLFSGLTAHNDPRNANGITLKSTSGVSFQNYGSNGSRNWRIRPDDQSRWGDLDFSVSPTANSATDWPDAASDKVLTLGYDGTVTKPRQPYFKANLSSGVRITSTGYVTFGAAVHNNGSHYNTSDGKFTAPVTGLYWFSARINAYDRIDFTIRVNGSDVERGQYNTDSDDVGWWSNQLTTLTYMTAGQYAQVYVSNLAQNSDPDTWVTYMGYLVC